MDVTVEHIPPVAVGNYGVQIRIRDHDGNNVGKLWFGQATVRWGAGNVPFRTAKRVPVERLIEFLEAQP
jgi:hypothetical protein